MALAPAASRRITFGGCVLVSAVGWWLGILPGVVWSVLVAGGLAVARRAAQQRAPVGPLAGVPLWQVLLVPILSVPIGIGFGVLVFILGPGF